MRAVIVGDEPAAVACVGAVWWALRGEWGRGEGDVAPPLCAIAPPCERLTHRRIGCTAVWWVWVACCHLLCSDLDNSDSMEENEMTCFFFTLARACTCVVHVRPAANTASTTITTTHRHALPHTTSRARALRLAPSAGVAHHGRHVPL